MTTAAGPATDRAQEPRGVQVRERGWYQERLDEIQDERGVPDAEMVWWPVSRTA